MQTNPVSDPFEDEPEFELEDNLVLMEGSDNDQPEAHVDATETKHALKVTDSASPLQDATQQFATAIHYYRQNDHYLAARWFRKSAMQGHGKAQLYLAMLFIKGQGVPKSLFHGYSWLSLAASQNVNEAISARKQIEPHLTARQIQSALKVAADKYETIEDTLS